VLRAGHISEYEREVLISEISKHVYNSRSFWLFSHENPDGDSLGCCLATFAALRSIGKEVKVLTTDLWRACTASCHTRTKSCIQVRCPLACLMW
jgi:hypothetical protein